MSLNNNDALCFQLQSTQSEQSQQQLIQALQSAGINGVRLQAPEYGSEEGQRGGIDWAIAAVIVPAIPAYVSLGIETLKPWLEARKGEVVKISVGDISVECSSHTTDDQWDVIKARLADIQALQKVETDAL